MGRYLQRTDGPGSGCCRIIYKGVGRRRPRRSVCWSNMWICVWVGEGEFLSILSAVAKQ